jgi:hypothetical protein
MVPIMDPAIIPPIVPPDRPSEVTALVCVCDEPLDVDVEVHVVLCCIYTWLDCIGNQGTCVPVELSKVAESVILSGKPVDVGIASDRANASGTVSLGSLARFGGGLTCNFLLC